jgi:hypothetical protein
LAPVLIWIISYHYFVETVQGTAKLIDTAQQQSEAIKLS